MDAMTPKSNSVGEFGRKSGRIFSIGSRSAPPARLSLLEQIAPFLIWPITVAGTQSEEDLAAAAIYAAPVNSEACAAQIFEAARKGCALVLSDLPTLRTDWSDAALFVPAGDEAAWCGVLNLLCADERMQLELGLRAQAAAARLGGRNGGQNRAIESVNLVEQLAGAKES